MNFCPHCGKPIRPGVRFCPHCGRPINNQPQMRPQINQVNYQYPRRHRHVFIKWLTAIAVIILAIGGGIFGYSQFNGTHKKPISEIITNHKNSSQSDSNHHSSPNKPGYTLSVFPKSIRGTWYSYDDDKLETLKITATAITDDGNTTYLHAGPVKSLPKMHPKHSTWIYASRPHKIRGIDLTEVRGWNQGAGDGASYGAFQSTDNSNNPITVLECAGGADVSLNGNFYQSKSTAEQMKKQVFTGEKKY